eukprot:7627437-Alexandrium_andersonii.AAC.1
MSLTLQRDLKRKVAMEEQEEQEWGRLQQEVLESSAGSTAAPSESDVPSPAAKKVKSVACLKLEVDHWHREKVRGLEQAVDVQ